MSRLVRFRVWDRGQWLDLAQGWLFFGQQHGEWLLYGKGGAVHQDAVIHQFTGFVDKTGRDIYEGDLVSFTIRGAPHGPEAEHETGAEVQWDDEQGCWSFLVRYGSFPGRYAYTVADRIDTETFEVTGNVLEAKAASLARAERATPADQS